MVLYWVFPFNHSFMNSLHSFNSCMNSFSLVHVFIYGFMVAVILGYIDETI